MSDDANNQALGQSPRGLNTFPFHLPSSLLASALTDSWKKQLFADVIGQKLMRRVATQPAPLHSFVQTMVLAKTN